VLRLTRDSDPEHAVSRHQNALLGSKFKHYVYAHNHLIEGDFKPYVKIPILFQFAPPAKSAIYKYKKTIKISMTHHSIVG